MATKIYLKLFSEKNKFLILLFRQFIHVGNDKLILQLIHVVNDKSILLSTMKVEIKLEKVETSS